MRKLFKLMMVVLFILSLVSLNGCKKFLDVTPQKTGSLKEVFTQRSKAKKYLYSIYHYLPNFGYPRENVGFFGGDELWLNPRIRWTTFKIALGRQNTTQPLADFWDGGRHGNDLYEAIRKCNIFLKRIDHVGNMTKHEMKRWKAEVKFLKAYFHFYLIRMYGPIIIHKHNTPVTAPANRIQRPRDSVNEAFSYVVELLNEVIHNPALPARISNVKKNLGRITKTIAYAVKAQVLITWASPLFNGNKAYVGYTNVNGENPFDTTYDPARWDSAAAAAKKAIEYAEAHGYSLYYFEGHEQLSDTTVQKMTIRNSVALGRGEARPNVIWPDVAHPFGAGDAAQPSAIPHGFDPSNPLNIKFLGRTSVPLKIVKMFYTSHGVPLKQDKTRQREFNEIVKSDSSSRFNIRLGYKTAALNFNRGPRFYADLGFDGSIWYGSGKYDDTSPSNLYYIRAKADQNSGYNQGQSNGLYSSTGYWPKNW